MIGVDIGATYIRAALSNLDGEFVFEIHRSTTIKHGFKDVMKQVGRVIEKLTKRAKTNGYRVFGIGVSVRGIVNGKTGMVIYSPVFQWHNVNLIKELHKYTDLKVTIGNDAQLIALGELYFGIGTQYDHFIIMKLGYGIGAGIVVNRQPFYGWEGYTGEIGHIVIDPTSELKGQAGLHGTLEVLASGYGVADIAKERIKEGKSSTLSKLSIESIDAKAVINAAIEGDKLAVSIVDSAAGYVGISIDTLIKLFNPQAVSLSGGMLRNEYLIKKIREKVESVSLSPYQNKVPILPSSFGEEATLMGAISLILQDILVLNMNNSSLPEIEEIEARIANGN